MGPDKRFDRAVCSCRFIDMCAIVRKIFEGEIKMYQHKSVSLHDCRADKMFFRNGILSFEFSNGYWVLPDHPQNHSEKIVRTGRAKIEFQIIDEEINGVTCYIFKVSRGGKVIREEWEMCNLINAVNNGTFQIEFIDEYEGYQSRLYKCWIWFGVKPYHYECEIILHNENIAYFWNELQYDHIW